MFTNTNKDKNLTHPDGKTFPSFSMKKSIFFTISILLIIGAFIQGAILLDRVTKSWDEIVFAYSKPNVVKTLRLDYLNKQRALDQSFSVKEKTSEQKLIDEVVKQLQNPSK